MDTQLRVSTISVVVIVAAVVLTAALGSHYSSMNRDWYVKLSLPSWKPPNWAFPVAWSAIYLLCAASLVLIWNTRPHSMLTYLAIGTFIANAVLNVAWSALFFGNRLILPAAYDAGLLLISIVMIILLAWPVSRLASILLAPYAIWVAFATVLTWRIHEMNL